MNGKVLLNVYTIQVKNDLLSIFVQNNYDFLEVFNRDELSFKYNLVKDNLDLYIHELDEINYAESLNQIKKIDLNKVRCIVLIHEYSSRIIDDALAMKVSDIVVLPMNKSNLAKKILSTSVQAINEKIMPNKPPVVEEETVFTFDTRKLDNELSRAIRGNYPLSLVMVDYGDLSGDNYGVFKDTLGELLRTTDRIAPYDENKMLLLCPFTPKENLVEVENKVREAHDKLKDLAINPGRVFLYGVTYPLDGSNAEELTDKMLDGLHDSILLSNLNMPLNRVSRMEMKNRLKRNY